MLAEYRGRQIGTQTLGFLEERCQTLNLQALHLEVEHQNLKAQRFYRLMQRLMSLDVANQTRALRKVENECTNRV